MSSVCGSACDSKLECDGGGCRVVRAVDVGSAAVAETAYAPGTRIAEHTITRPQLCLVLEGGYEERYRQATLTCRPASLYFHAPGEAHSNRFDRRGGRCLIATIPPSLLEVLDGPALERLETSVEAVPSRSAFELRDQLASEDDPASGHVRELVLALLDDLVERPGLAPAGEPPSWLERVRRRIEEEFVRAPSLADLARIEGVHHVSLARAFRHHYGCTVGAYIRQKRVTFACRALVSTRADLSAIAYRAGFADQSHFTRTFKRFLGLTPGAFRTWRRRG